MRKITELYLERVFNDMRREDMNIIKANLKRLCNADLTEVILTNTVDNVWIDMDSIFELVRNGTKDTFEKVFKVTNVRSDNRDNAKVCCFKVGIDDFGNLTITIECNVEGLAWTSEENIEYMAKKSYMRYSENKKSERYNIPFRREMKFTRTFNLDSIKEYILKSE